MTYTILWGNRPETDYSRCLDQHNPSLKENFSMRQDTKRQAQKEGIPTTKEITEAFSAVTGQEIGEEGVDLIQSIQLSEEEGQNFVVVLNMFLILF